MKFIFWAVILFGVMACEKKPALPIEGEWHRWVKVPAGQQGRCYEETLSIEYNDWSLTFLMYSSFLCEQAALEIRFEGGILTVLPPKYTEPWVASVEDIRITQVSNITQGEKQALTKEAVARFDQQFISLENRTFLQKVWVKKPQLTVANLYLPAYQIANPDVPFKPLLKAYTRKYPEG